MTKEVILRTSLNQDMRENKIAVPDPILNRKKTKASKFCCCTMSSRTSINFAILILCLNFIGSIGSVAEPLV